jgi:uncharacterized protein (DUF58 family)
MIEKESHMTCTMFKNLFFVAGLLLLAVGCASAAETPSIESVTLSKTTVKAGESVDITVKVKNFNITGHGSTSGDSNVQEGHFHVYFDDKSSPSGMGMEETYALKIPTDMSAGAHKIRVELVDSAHTILNPTVETTVDFTVE